MDLSVWIHTRECVVDFGRRKNGKCLQGLGASRQGKLWLVALQEAGMNIEKWKTRRSEARAFAENDRDPYLDIARQWATEERAKQAFRFYRTTLLISNFALSPQRTLSIMEQSISDRFSSGQEVGYLHARFYPQKTTSHASFTLKQVQEKALQPDIRRLSLCIPTFVSTTVAWEERSWFSYKAFPDPRTP